MEKLAGTRRGVRHNDQYPWHCFNDTNHYHKNLSTANGYFLRFYKNFKKHQEQK